MLLIFFHLCELQFCQDLLKLQTLNQMQSVQAPLRNTAVHEIRDSALLLNLSHMHIVKCQDIFRAFGLYVQERTLDIQLTLDTD